MNKGKQRRPSSWQTASKRVFPKAGPITVTDLDGNVLRTEAPITGRKVTHRSVFAQSDRGAKHKKGS